MGPVKVKMGEGWYETEWPYFTAVSENWDYCVPGPLFYTLALKKSISGKKNLRKHDADNAGLEIGRAGDLSTPRAKGETNIPTCQPWRHYSGAKTSIFVAHFSMA